MVDVTGAQVRMARAALGWSLADLADHAGVGLSTVRTVEASDNPAAISGGIAQTLDVRTAQRAESLAKIERALTAAGVTFLRPNEQGAGIRLKPRKAR
jgi:transcriptional regulator with XRE-family HTH domain